MDNIRQLVRPVIVLLLIGVIVGLIFLYQDFGRISADNDLGNNIQNNESTSDNKDNESLGQNNDSVKNENDSIVPDVDSGDNDINDNNDDELKSSIPRSAEGDKLVISQDMEYNSTHNFVNGYVVVGSILKGNRDFKTNGNKSIGLALIDGKTLSQAITISEDENIFYVTSRVGRYGLIVLAKGKNYTYIYNVDYDFKLKSRRVIDAKIDARILSDENIIICYQQNNKISIVSYDDNLNENSILNIDNNGKIISIFNDIHDNYDIVTSNGMVYKCNIKEIINSISIGSKVLDAKHVIINKNICIGAIVEDNENRYFKVYDMAFNEVLSNKTNMHSILLLNNVYLMSDDGKTVEKFCTCGEYIGKINTDIKRVNCIDYLGKRLSITDNNNDNYIYNCNDNTTIKLSDMVVDFQDNFKIFVEDKLVYIDYSRQVK